MSLLLPAVSVVIPTYNAPLLLMETLATVFAQSMTDFEVVVINDGSTDDTAERLAPLAAEGRIRLINQENGGIGKARNRGIEEARGTYVALLDHDDLWRPQKLAVQVAYMEAHRECAACGVRWSMSPSPEKEACDFNKIVDDGGRVVRPLHQLAEGQVFLITSTILFDRARASGLKYMPYRRCIEDTPFQIGLLGRGRFGIAGQEILMEYRVHTANYSGQSEFFYSGIKMLRQLDREGAFAGLLREDQIDLGEFLAHLGRTATATQLTAGERLKAIEVYMREWPYQVRAGAWKYLAGAPILALLPRSISARVLQANSQAPGTPPL